MGGAHMESGTAEPDAGFPRLSLRLFPVITRQTHRSVAARGLRHTGVCNPPEITLRLPPFSQVLGRAWSSEGYQAIVWCLFYDVLFSSVSHNQS